MLVVCLLALVALPGCKKKSWPTYYQLDGQQQVLLARDGEPAYLGEEMAGIIAALRAAPPDCREFEQATKLADKLAAEQARVKSAEDAKKAVVAKPPPPLPRPAVDPFKPLPPAPVDAGVAVAALPDEPYAGMSEADFLKAFGKCFTPGPATSAPDGGAATTQLVKNDPACTKWGPPGNETSYVFVAKSGLWGSLTRPPPTLQKVPVPPEPPKLVAAADAGERIITLPGAPVREGYRRESELVDAGSAY